MRVMTTFEQFNPLTRNNPMWPHVNALGRYQRQDLIKKDDIDGTLSAMEEINRGWERLATALADGRRRGQLQKGVEQFKRTIAGVRADLNNPAMYKLVDGQYIKMPKG